MRHRQRSLVIAALALALSPCATQAQDDPAKTADAKAMLARVGQAFSSPEIAPSLPVTPERRALVLQYLESANAVAALKAFSDLSYSQAEAQMTAITKELPKTKQSIVMQAVSESFSAAQTNLQARIIDEMETYYAARMTDDELKTVIDFYESGLGYKMLHEGQTLTAEERQKAGQYMFSNPAMIKFVKLNFDYMKGAQTRRQASQVIFNADFNARFCQALAKDHLKMSTCPAPGLHQTSR